MSTPPKTRSRFRSVRARTLIMTTFIVVMAVVVVVTALIRREQTRIVQAKEEEARVFTAALAGMSIIDLMEHNWGNINPSLHYSTQQNDDLVYGILVDATHDNMMVAAVPSELNMTYVPDLVRKEVTEAALAPFKEVRTQEAYLLRDVVLSGDRLRGVEGERILEVDRALISERGERVGTLRIGISLREVAIATRRSIEVGVGVGAAALLLALVVAFVFATRLTRPIEALSTRLRGVGEGDIETDAPVRGNDEIADLARSFNAMLMGLRQKRMLEKYVPMGARADIDKRHSGKVALGGARLRKAILFSDLRGFTSTSERLSPDEVVRVLNAYLEKMTGVILASGGDINEYIGDAILAVFTDARSAVDAAVGMQRALVDVRQTTADEEVRALRMGIGIHVGDVVEGNIGTDERVKFGVVGDTVNVASRIQDRSRDGKHTHILVSAAVEAETRSDFDFELFGDIALKGKAESVKIFEVLRRR